MPDKVLVLPDGETFSEIKGCVVAIVPDGTVKSLETAQDDVSLFLREGNFHSIDIRELLNVCQDIVDDECGENPDDELTVVKTNLIQKLREILSPTN